MISNKSRLKKLSLDDLVFSALSQLQIFNYHVRSIRRYQSIWKRLIMFAKKHKFKNKLSEKLILDFLAYHDIRSDLPIRFLKGWKKHAEFSLKILWNYARFGYFERYHVVLRKLNIPSAMQKILREYKKYCEEKRHYSQYSVNECIHQLSLLLDFLRKRKIKTFNQIQAKDLSDFVCTLSHFSQKTISCTVSHVRVFLRFLLFKGKLKIDLSQTLPSIRVPRDGKIPSVWDKDLLEQLLNAVDRSSPKGKRDYAILLLACRLGIRLNDIREITLDNIDWERETISIIQAKTKRLLCLPLINEVGNALIDYIKFARPKMNYRQVFLSLKSPYAPLRNRKNLYHIVQYWRNLAGIEFKQKQRHGMHSLRHSLASYLLEENTPFHVISNILGHASMNTTMIYAKSSVETLRQVALSMKEVGHVN